MLADGAVLMAYAFEDYWKDVGTIESLWEAHMDLLGEKPVFNLADTRWRIYARNPIMPPHYVGQDAYIADSMVTEGCEVYGSVEHSVLFAGVVVEKGANIVDSVIMPGTVVRKGACVTRTIVSENCVIGENCVVGAAGGPIALVGYSTRIPAGVRVAAGEQTDEEKLSEEAAHQ